MNSNLCGGHKVEQLSKLDEKDKAVCPVTVNVYHLGHKQSIQRVNQARFYVIETRMPPVYARRFAFDQDPSCFCEICVF